MPQVVLPLAIIENYLPKQMPEEEIVSIIQNVINETNAQSPSDMGKVMAEIKNHKSSSQIDMANASSYVKIVLNS